MLEPLLEVELMSELVRAFATGRPTEVDRTVAEARAATRVAKVFNMRSKSSGEGIETLTFVTISLRCNDPRGAVTGKF